MKIAYVFFNGQLEGSKEFYTKLINEKKGDIYCADGGATKYFTIRNMGRS